MQTAEQQPVPAPVYVKVFFTLTAGELSYPLPSVVVKNEQGDVEAALQAANQQMRDNYLDSSKELEYALDERLPEWQRGFWHDGQHTIRISGHHTVSETHYDAYQLLDQVYPY